MSDTKKQGIFPVGDTSIWELGKTWEGGLDVVITRDMYVN